MTFSLQALLDAGGELYEVGGMVRDALLHRETVDRDYVVRLLSVDRITALLKPFGKVTLVGESFGIIKFSPHQNPHEKIDIALPRKEYSTGQGHRDFSVSFNPELPIEDDLGRRDFTINAMARNVATGKIIDPFHGQMDLNARKLRMVFPKAFEEDPLRMLRAFQFAARFELSIEAETFEAIKRSKALIQTVPSERTIEELRKLFLSPKPSVGFRLMANASLLEQVIPELAALIGIEQDKQPGDDVFAHTMRTLDAARSDSALIEPGEINLMFAALFHDVGKAKTRRFHPPSQRVVFFGHQIVSAKQARKWMQHMKVETIGVNPEKVAKLIEHHMFETKASFTDRSIRRFVAKIGKELVFTLLDLRLADNRGGKHPAGIKGVLRLRQRIREEIERKAPFGPKDLALNGHDLIAAGIHEGPMMGKMLRELVELVLDSPELNTPEALLSRVQELQHEEHAKQKEEKTRHAR